MLEKQITCLLIDDLAPLRKTLSSQLYNIGVKKIFFASNGMDALKILNKNTIDVILSVWNIPIMNGFDLLKYIRSEENLRHIPFILITDNTERERIIEAISFGVSDLLVLPYNRKRLCKSLETAISWKPNKLNFEEYNSEIKSKLTSTFTEDETNSSSKTDRFTILIVDDTQDNLILLSELFKDEYDILVAKNGAKALNICFAKKNIPDLVLLDIMMPGMDGFEVASRMREHPHAGIIPIIFITAMTHEDMQIKALELGAVDFVTKPIDPNTLKQRVRNFIRHIKLRKQLQDDYDHMLEVARLYETSNQITKRDIKEPLTHAIKILQTLSSKDSTISQKYIQQILLAKDKISQSINLINLSSAVYEIENKLFKFYPQPIKIVYLLQSVIKILRSIANEKQIIISLQTQDDSAEIMGDSLLCCALFQSLIQNACETAPKDSNIYVIIYNEDPLKILIKNRYIIPTPLRDNYFSKFLTNDTQIESGYSNYAVKLLVEAQNGKIKLDVSENENATTISVFLQIPPLQKNK